MSRALGVFTLSFLIVLSFCTNAIADDVAPLPIGEGVAALQSAGGPAIVNFNLNDCKFSLSLSSNQHVKYNGPDAILYQSANDFPKNQLPYLQQTNTSVGYDWSFRKRGSTSDKWFGMMCENVSDFYWSINPDQIDGLNPGMQQVMDLNSEKCPADYRNGKWIANKQTAGAIFRPFSGDGWSGFVAGSLRKDNTKYLNTMRFCVVTGDKVLIGASEDDQRKLNIPAPFLDDVYKLLSTFKIGNNKP